MAEELFQLLGRQHRGWLLPGNKSQLWDGVAQRGRELIRELEKTQEAPQADGQVVDTGMRPGEGALMNEANYIAGLDGPQATSSSLKSPGQKLSRISTPGSTTGWGQAANFVQMTIKLLQEPFRGVQTKRLGLGRRNKSMPMQRVHQPPDGSPAGPHGARGWDWTSAAGQMLRKKLACVICLDCLYRDAPSPQPPTKMFDRLNVRLDGVVSVPALMQITYESAENYGEMVAGHPTARKRTLEVTLDHGNR